MVTIAKAFKFIGEVNTFIGDIIDQVLAMYKFRDEYVAFLKEYLHEHPDEIDNVYLEVKCSNPSFSVLEQRKKYLL